MFLVSFPSSSLLLFVCICNCKFDNNSHINHNATLWSWVNVHCISQVHLPHPVQSFHDATRPRPYCPALYDLIRAFLVRICFVTELGSANRSPGLSFSWCYTVMVMWAVCARICAHVVRALVRALVRSLCVQATKRIPGHCQSLPKRTQKKFHKEEEERAITCWRVCKRWFRYFQFSSALQGQSIGYFLRSCLFTLF